MSKLISRLSVVLLLVSKVALGAPNIILIIGDDNDPDAYGFASSQRTLETNQGTTFLHDVVQTPNLDTLANTGTVFMNGHSVASVCRPSLRALLTGLQPLQWEASPYDSIQHMSTVPKQLAGYLSWQGGKYWDSPYGFAGFTHGLAATEGEYLEPDGWDIGRTGIEPLREFLDEAGDQPFFVWFAPQLPHSPYDAPQRYRDYYEALGLNDDHYDCEGHPEDCPTDVRYLANVSWLDDVVGDVLDELDSRGLRENTLIIYLSDNGFGFQEQYFAASGYGKGTPYELGFRTPIIFNWPEHVPSAQYNDLVSSLDVPATVLDYAGAEPIAASQGASLKPRLEGGTQSDRSYIAGFYSSTGYFVRTYDWRYIRLTDGTEELYEINNDPLERNDVAQERQGVKGLLSAVADQWEQQLPPPGC